MTDIRLDGRVAVVTGAGGGLGRSHALLLASRGARLLVNDLGGSREGDGGGTSMADAVVEEIKAAGGDAIANYDSVADASGGEAMIKAAFDEWGSVDIVVANAGIIRDRAFHNLTQEDWDLVFAVHTRGAFNVVLPAVRIMRQQSYGRIVLTTSAAGLYGNFGQGNYSAAKLALVGLMNTLELEGRKYNIGVNTIAPVAASRLTEDILEEQVLEKLAPEYVSPIVAYLCSEACDVSGRIYTAGGGYFGRAAIMEGEGAYLGPDVPSIEDVVARLDEINDLSNAREFRHAGEEGVTRIFSRQADTSG